MPNCDARITGMMRNKQMVKEKGDETGSGGGVDTGSDSGERKKVHANQ